MQNYEDKKISIPGFSLAIKEWFPNNNKPVLCLPGYLDNAASFDFLAPLLNNWKLAAIDYPGVGLSSGYHEGILPHWKNDAFLMLHLIKTLQWEQFDIIAHSFGSLLALIIALALPKQVKKIVFLDILGPKVNLVENSISDLEKNAQTFLNYQNITGTIFTDLEAAIKDRMQENKLSYEAASVLVTRGIEKYKQGYRWAYDKRLRCISSTLPHEDELIALFQRLNNPVQLIRASEGIDYPDNIFLNRVNAIKNLSIHEIEGGHHVHMNNPNLLAPLISQFLLS